LADDGMESADSVLENHILVAPSVMGCSHGLSFPHRERSDAKYPRRRSPLSQRELELKKASRAIVAAE